MVGNSSARFEIVVNEANNVNVDLHVHQFIQNTYTQDNHNNNNVHFQRNCGHDLQQNERKRTLCSCERVRQIKLSPREQDAN